MHNVRIAREKKKKKKMRGKYFPCQGLRLWKGNYNITEKKVYFPQ